MAMHGDTGDATETLPVVWFAGGGSGGHLYPGIAVAEELRRRSPDLQLGFFCSERPIDRQILVGQSWPFTPLPVDSLSDFRKRPWFSSERFQHALRQATQCVKQQRPRCVIGLGGFASVPLLIAAVRQRVPCVLLEQNAVPGRVTRWFHRHAAATILSDPAAERWLRPLRRLERFALWWLLPRPEAPVPPQCLGNPVRRAIAAAADHCDSTAHSSATSLPGITIPARTFATMPSPGSTLPPRPLVLILGGSQGAQGLNRAVLAAIQSAVRDSSPGINDLRTAAATSVSNGPPSTGDVAPSSVIWRSLQIVHQTGPTDVEAVRGAYSSAGINAVVEPFFPNLLPLYQQATLVIARAGATTLAEWACFGKPAILVPLPTAADDHQRANARAWSTAGAAVVVEQTTPDATGWGLTTAIERFLTNPAGYQAAAVAARGLARPQAAAAVAAIVERWL